MFRLTGTIVRYELLLTNFLFRIDDKHVVFGSVIDGMEVVRAIEKVGSQSGETRKKVVIADCGQIK
jgi:cyclophilin family peptidyl-prolyl cis-trans isomerase